MKKNIMDSNYFISKYMYLLKLYKEQINIIQKKKTLFFYKKKYEELEENYYKRIMNTYLQIEEELKYSYYE